MRVKFRQKTKKMKVTENFKLFLNGKEVTEQEIRDCKESMSVTVDNLCCFYSFSPKIESGLDKKIRESMAEHKSQHDKLYKICMDEISKLLEKEAQLNPFMRFDYSDPDNPKVISAKRLKTEENKQGHLSTRHKKPAAMNRMVEDEIEKQEFEAKVKHEYQGVLKTTGMFFVWYPHLTGDWEKDKTEYLDIYKNLVDMRKTYKENQINYHQVVTDKEQPTGNVTTSSYTQYPMIPDESFKVSSETGERLFFDKDCNLISAQKTEKQGVKHNKGKLPLDTMITKQFPNALEAVCKATQYGHHKYILSDHYYDNFKKVEGGSQTYADAGQRHNLYKNEIDQESGLPHIYLKCWNALAELEIWIEENKTK